MVYMLTFGDVATQSDAKRKPLADHAGESTGTRSNAASLAALKSKNTIKGQSLVSAASTTGVSPLAIDTARICPISPKDVKRLASSFRACHSVYVIRSSDVQTVDDKIGDLFTTARVDPWVCASAPSRDTSAVDI